MAWQSQYAGLLREILDSGYPTPDRTGVGTKSLFGKSIRVDLQEGFPLLTLKKVPFRLIVTELLWFLQGRTDKQWLTDRNNHIWDEWDSPEYPGYIGPGYSWQWRCYNAPYDPSYAPGWEESDRGLDQIADLLTTLKYDPYSRRHIVDAWNPEFLFYMALPPCHQTFQMYVRDGKLSCHLYQRSADMFLGVPFNIASYALLTHIIAIEVGLEVGELVWTGGDCHVYNNHVSQVEEIISRKPYPLPHLVVQPPIKEKNQILPPYMEQDFTLHNYNSHSAIKAPVAV